MSKCPHCGGIAGKAHVCRAAVQKMRGEELVEPATREAMKRKLKNIERDVDRDSAAALVEVKSRKGKKQLAVWIDPELHREIKVMAAEDGLTIEQFIIDAVIQERKSRG